MGTSINKTQSLYLKNNSGQTVTKGDCVVLDKTVASAFTLTGSQAYSLTQLGVVLDQTNVASGQSCLVAIAGYVPQINLVTGASIGDSFYLSSVSKKAQAHSPQTAGDFGEVLNSGLTPDAILFGNIASVGVSINADYLLYAYTGAHISMGTTDDANFVDLANAQTTFTPTSPGKYMVVAEFGKNTNAGSITTYFRLTDGTTISHALYTNNTRNVEGPVSISYIFNWSDTTTKTVKLQKRNDGTSGVGSSIIVSDGFATRSFRMMIYRIGS